MSHSPTPSTKSIRKRADYSGRSAMTSAWVRKDIVGESMPNRDSVFQGPISDYDLSNIEPIIKAELNRDELDMYMPGIWYSLNKRGRWANVHKLTDVADLSEERRFVSTAVYNLAPNGHPVYHMQPWNSHRTNQNTHQAREFHAVLPRGTDDESTEIHRYGHREGTHMDVLMKTGETRRRCRAGKCHREGCPDLHAGDDRQHPAPLDKHAIGVEYNVVGTVKSADLWRREARIQAYYRNDRGYVRRRGCRRRKGADVIADSHKAMENEELDTEDVSDEEVTNEVLKDATSSNMTVSLADCLVRRSKKQKNKKKRKPFNITEPFDWTITDGEESDTSDEVDDGDFVMIEADPFIVHDAKITKDSLTSDHLRETFGQSYYECSTVPRRIVINLSIDAGTTPWTDEYFPSAVLVVEVQPGDGDDVDATFWLNSIELDDGSDICLDVDKSYSIGALVDIVRQSLSDDQDASTESTASSDDSASFSSFEMIDKPETSKSTHVPIELIGDRIAQVEYHGAADADRLALCDAQLVKSLQRQLTITLDAEATTASIRRKNRRSTDMAECGVCACPLVDSGRLQLAATSCVTGVHTFCVACHHAHCRYSLHSGRVPITCPQSNCKTEYDLDTLSSILPLIHCRRYAQLLAQRHLLANPGKFVFCPNERCDRLLQVQDVPDGEFVLSCKCGRLWCWACKAAPHWPITCEHTARYLTKLEADGQLTSDLRTSSNVVSARRCPKCKQPVTKASGCNQMTCTCGASFCWACTKPWTGGSHYNCHFDTSRNEAIRLSDVRRRGVSMLSNRYYDLCLAHRVKHNDSSHYRPLATAVRAKAVLADHSLFKGTGNQFVHWYRHAHAVLERFYVWLYLYQRHRPKESQNRKDICRFLERHAKRTAFVLQLVETKCLSGELSQVVGVVDKASYMLEQLTRWVTNVKKKND